MVMCRMSGYEREQQKETQYTDTADFPRYSDYAGFSSYSYPTYPAQSRTYVVQTSNWDQTQDYTASGLAATQATWTRTELHNTN